ncbi:hypothetical protein LTR56_026655 [Elasticomyces elasticus]|nr:hypothetical protein LTR56_026655 [Elasticomyces elasticus]KAK3662831.1 hypothetical protein LTR22_006234 [Elasticomyces elasticus]KAK4930026.1 hypothetical protein LTR49_003354 [Elasticomyces elasticus]KAK5749181.1 hypothetical protein LTS12_020749 [Elasticomyces elasticus]
MALMAPAIVAPMQLGNSKVLDANSELLISLCRYSSSQSMTITQLEPLSRSYLKALKLAMVSVTTPHLRDQDETVAALSLLFATGTLIQLYDRSWDGGMSHLSGAFALLCAKPPNRRASPAIRAALCAAGFHTFISPTFAGIVSPFEDPAWLDMELVQLRDPSEKLVRLRRVNHQLFIKLPRFIAGVRALRNGEMDVLAEIMVLSDELMALEDKEAETWLLHRVRIVNTRDSGDKVIVGCFSFESPVLEEMDAAICYWQMYLTLTKLRSVVASLAPSALVGAGPCKPQDRMIRLCANILMTWQYASDRSPCGTMSMTLALNTVWAALRGCTFYHNIPVAVVGTWLFKAFQRSWLGWTTRQSFAHFDGVCAVLDGGPLSLFMLDAMKGPRSSTSLHAHKNQKATTRRTNAK